MALSTSVNWISNFIIAFITPPLFGSIQGGYYFLLVGFTCISGVFVYFVYPETAGKTLEELGEVLVIRLWTVAQRRVEGIWMTWRLRRRVPKFRWRQSR
jgi:hypothetical protein